jgi:RHS repeat-associated protein
LPAEISSANVPGRWARQLADNRDVDTEYSWSHELTGVLDSAPMEIMFTSITSTSTDPLSGTTVTGPNPISPSSNVRAGTFQPWVESQAPTPATSFSRSYLTGLSVEAQAESTTTLSNNQTAPGPTYALARDPYGSVRALVDPAGQTPQRFDYRAFGDPAAFEQVNPTTQTATSLPDTQAATIHLHGGGAEWDPVTRRYYHDARWRDARSTWLSRDPYEAPTGDLTDANKYAFVGNNPGNATDPTGMFSFTQVFVGTSALAGLSAIFGGAIGARTGGVLGAIGGAAGAATATYASVALIFAFGGAGPVGVVVGSGIGSALGTWTNIAIVDGPSAALTAEGKLQLAISFLVGAAIGWWTGGSSVYLAQEIGRKLLSSPSIRQLVLGAITSEQTVQPRRLAETMANLRENPMVLGRAIRIWQSQDMVTPGTWFMAANALRTTFQTILSSNVTPEQATAIIPYLRIAHQVLSSVMGDDQ